MKSTYQPQADDACVMLCVMLLYWLSVFVLSICMFACLVYKFQSAFLILYVYIGFIIVLSSCYIMHTGKWSLPKLSEWTDQSASIASSGDTILRSIADGLPLGDTLVGSFFI